jgi:catechol 2,3-dioxygenase-like lactoylglutathione lyase family enzyme
MLVASLRLELFVRDLAEAVAFYRDVLGFTVLDDSDDYVGVRLGGVTFGLGPQDRLPANHHFGAEGLARQKGVGVEIVIEVDDIAALHDRVAASGYPIASGLKRRPWGATDFRVVDPDGYYLRPTSRE